MAVDGRSPTLDTERTGTWTGADARSIAAVVRNREVTARRVVEDHLALIAEQNTRLNAIVTVAVESALAEADALDQRLDRGEVAGPLAGVPFTAKDLIATAGVRTTAASRALADNVPVVDAPAVAAMKAAGAILVGKTNTPEFGTSGLTDNEMFGPAVNPLGSLESPRSPGGSSGGEAASIASGMSVLGLGTDFGGSVRWPAHCTGLCSIRPTVGRVSADGQYPGVLVGDHVRANPTTVHGVLQTVGPMARNLDDLVLALRVISEPHVAWTDPATVDVDALTITWADGDGTVPVVDEIVDVVRESARRLGAHPYCGSALVEGNELFGRLRATQTHTDIDALASPDRFGAVIRDLLSTAGRAEHREVEGLWAWRTALIHRLLDEMGDVLVLPVASIGAPPLGDDRFAVGDRLLTWQEALASCRTISVTGLPSVVVPVGRTSDGMPIGVQIVARPFHDHVALAVAARL
ncbi:amidase [Rhodococcus rhodochrous]|uniref:amidase n=1 Tax=Rhodococcus rhodochrous TaxID=1829 RepID=A0AAW4XDP8_RHORH|nr:amidase [Rhodococcus rhodochrous]MCD2111533.1 amidase [Rhodococcus rhodochrous]